VSDETKKWPLSGVIRPTLKGIKNGVPENLKFTTNGGKYVVDETDRRFKEDIAKNITKGLSSIMTNLTASFGTGRFVYPGTRTLKFRPPTVNDYGDSVHRRV
jgi:hypothetical protein